MRPAIVLLFALLAGNAHGSDSINVSLQADRAPGLSGGGAAADWQHGLAGDRRVSSGLSAFRFGDADWHFVRLGYLTPLPARLTLTMGADIGGGNDGVRNFHYRVGRAGLLRPLVAGKLNGALEAQHIDIDRVRGTIWKASLTANIRNVAEATAGYHLSSGGNLEARYLSLRLDIRQRFLAGGAFGRTILDPQRLQLLPASHSTELFGGVTFRRRLTLVLDRLRVGTVHRYTALASWKLGR